ncbi:MAG: leucyl aminopeptidase, partial [Rhodospirillaceae bacterium]|nr:leucyl aminopeptidase [Rhodospirillaceae bacterium]
MKISFANPSKPKSGTAVVGVMDGRKLCTSATALDKLTHGAIGKAIRASSFKGAKNHSLTIMTPAGTRLERILCIGVGKAKDLDERAFETIGGRIYASLKAQSEKAHVLLDDMGGCKLSSAEMAVHVGIGARLASYKFDKYKTKKKGHAKLAIKELAIQCAGSAVAKRSFAKQNKVIDGVFFTRDLISEPSNVLFPKALAAEAKSLSKLGVKIEILDKAKMTKLGMGALLGVAQGSAHEPFMVVMRWDGAAKKDKPVAFVGKGVTFDTGGISLKPAGGMEDMKYDMG